MTILGFGLVLAAAFCHAIWNFFVKRINGGPELVWLFSLISVGLYLPVVIFIALQANTSLGRHEIVLIAVSAALHLGYFLLLQQGYRKGDLSLVYPIARATGPLLSTTFAVVILGERISFQIAAGATVIIIGVLLLTGGFKRGGKQTSTSILFGLGVGIIISSYTLWDAFTVSKALVSPLLLDYASSIGRSVLLAPIAVKRKKLIADYWRDHRLGVLAIAVFNPLAYLLVLYALTFTPVVYIAPTREMSVLIGVMMGAILLGEGELKRRLLWAALIVFGVVLLATA